MSNTLHNTLQQLLQIPAVYTSPRAAMLINEALTEYEAEQLAKEELSPLAKKLREASVSPEAHYSLWHDTGMNIPVIMMRTKHLSEALKWESMLEGDPQDYKVKVYVGRQEIDYGPIITFIGFFS
jgi:CRISPR/Cas system-associated protein Csm6